MNTEKQIMDVLKKGTPVDAYIRADSTYTSVTISVNCDYRVVFWRIKYRASVDVTDRYFKIIRVSNNDYNTIYEGKISEENYAEYDYLIKIQAEKFVNSEIRRIFLSDDAIF